MDQPLAMSGTRFDLKLAGAHTRGRQRSWCPRCQLREAPFACTEFPESRACRAHCSRMLTSVTKPVLRATLSVLISNGWKVPDHWVFANARLTVALDCRPVDSKQRTMM